jgi:predicted GIY-YIG superfamily endonuclease
MLPNALIFSEEKKIAFFLRTFEPQNLTFYYPAKQLQIAFGEGTIIKSYLLRKRKSCLV